MARDPALHADHLLQAIANIEADLAGCDFETFRQDRRTKQLVERNLEIISEASRRLPDELKSREKTIEWRAIAGIGNILRHDYHESHPTMLWETCQKDLAPLKAAVTRIRREVVRRKKTGNERKV